MIPVDAPSVRPGGKLPMRSDHVYGRLPPIASSWAEYATETVPSGKVIVLIESGGVTVIDSDARLVNVEVAAGHNEIVGDKQIVPRKLLEVLQQQGILAPTPPERQAAFERLLVALYSR